MVVRATETWIRAGKSLAWVLLLGLFSCGQDQGIVGVLLPLQGDAMGEWALDAERAFQLAYSEMNESSRPEHLVVGTDGSPASTVEGFNLLVASGANVVIGPLGTGDAVAAANVARRAGVPLVTPAATGAGVTEGNDWAFRFCYTDVEVGDALATFARKDLGVTRMAVVVDQNLAYAVGLSDAFMRSFTKKRGIVLEEIGFWGGQAAEKEASLSALERACQLDVEAVLLAGYGVDLVDIVNATSPETIGDIILLGGDGWDSDGMRQAMADRSHGAYYTSHFSKDEPLAKVTSFVEAFSSREGSTPGSIGALTYDTAKAVLAVHDPKADGLRMRELIKRIDHDGVTGWVDLRSRHGGDPYEKSIVLEQMHDPNSLRFKKRINRLAE